MVMKWTNKLQQTVATIIALAFLIGAAGCGVSAANPEQDLALERY
jgi:hypothetical protein